MGDIHNNGEPRHPPSIRIRIRDNESKQFEQGERSNNSNGHIGNTFFRSQPSLLRGIKAEWLGDVPPPPRERLTPSSKGVAEIITLASSDEEDALEGENDIILPDCNISVKLENGRGEHFRREDGDDFEGKRKSLRKKLPPKKFATSYTSPFDCNGGKKSSMFTADIRRNIGELQNICQYCGRKLTTMKALAEHIQKQHLTPKGISLYQCQTCGKKLKSEHGLKTHRLIHSDNRHFSCELCKTKYKSQFYLDRHYKSKGHLSVESVKKFIHRPLSQGSTGTGGDDDESWSPSPPPLSPETPEMGTQPKTKPTAANSRSVALTETSTSATASEQQPPVSTASTITQNSTSSQPQQPQVMDMTNNSNGVIGSMMHPMQSVANPVLFYGYMMPSNGAPMPGNAYPSAIQPTSYFPSQSNGGSYLSYSGVPGYMPTTTPMQQMNFQSNPSQTFNGQTQKSSMLTCFECQALFSVDSHLRKHIKESHPNKYWKCPKCSEVMLSPTEFEQHFGQCSK